MDESVGPFVEHPARNPPRAMGGGADVLLVGKIIFGGIFSSRRRHTRCLSDWSSDVCSSDLTAAPRSWTGRCAPAWKSRYRRSEIGRGSCREREEISGGAGSSFPNWSLVS